MPPNETSALLLKNYHDHQYTSDYNSTHNNASGNDVGGGYHAVDDSNHIVYVNKDSSEYEPIFCLNGYASSLTLDELLPYKFDPWWQNLRRFLLLTFWLLLLLTFLTACLLSYLQAGHKSCNILEKQISANSVGTPTFASDSIFPITTTTFPITIAKVLSTELLVGK